MKQRAVFATQAFITKGQKNRRTNIQRNKMNFPRIACIHPWCVLAVHKSNAIVT